MSRALLILLFTSLAFEVLWANVLWSSTGNTPPRHRNITIESGAPCGAGESVTPTILTSGKTVELEWEEFIPQNGYFEIYFSPANDSDWVLLKRVENPVEPGSSEFSKIHKTNVELPEVNCEACSLQVVQTVAGVVDAKYYSCTDVKLTGDANGGSINKDICSE